MTENSHAASIAGVILNEILVKATNVHNITITDLPREIMVKILRYFSPEELCRISLSCRQLNDDTRDPALWKEFQLTSNRRSKDHCEAITTLVSRCSLLRTVSVTRRTDVKDLIPSLAASCPGLRHLKIKYCSSLRLSGIMKLLKLERLVIWDALEVEPHEYVAAFSEAKLLQLRHLDLTGCVQLQDAGVQAIAMCCPNLTFFNIFYAKDVTDEGITSVISQCNGLRDFKLRALPYIRGNFIASIHLSLPNLKSLDVRESDGVPLSSLRLLHASMQDLKIVRGTFWSGHLVN